MGGSLHPQLKLGRYPVTPGPLMNSLVPPASRVVQASVTRYRVSPALGTVIRRGDLRTDCVFEGLQELWIPHYCFLT